MRAPAVCAPGQPAPGQPAPVHAVSGFAWRGGEREGAAIWNLQPLDLPPTPDHQSAALPPASRSDADTSGAFSSGPRLNPSRRSSSSSRRRAMQRTAGRAGCQRVQASRGRGRSPVPARGGPSLISGQACATAETLACTCKDETADGVGGQGGKHQSHLHVGIIRLHEIAEAELATKDRGCEEEHGHGYHESVETRYPQEEDACGASGSGSSVYELLPLNLSKRRRTLIRKEPIVRLLDCSEEGLPGHQSSRRGNLLVLGKDELLPVRGLVLLDVVLE